MEVKKIREMTGMSQARFAEKYGIPKRTVEAWEMGERTAPEYVMEMLTKVVKMEEVNMKAWMFSEYRDSRGTGSQKLFKTKEEALRHGWGLWNGLNKADRDSYLNDDCGEFLVAEVPVEWDETDEDWIAVTADGYVAVWDGLEDERKKREWNKLRDEIITEMESYDDFELFVSEYGWKDWMNEFTAAKDGEEITEAEAREIDALLKSVWESHR